MLSATWRIRDVVDAAMTTRLEHHVDPQSNNFVWYVLISVFLVALAGLMSGDLLLCQPLRTWRSLVMTRS